MPKRRRLTMRKRTPVKQTRLERSSKNEDEEETESEQVVPEPSTPRTRLKGALLDALEPVEEDSDSSLDKTELNSPQEEESASEEEYNVRAIPTKKADTRTAYVLKLFDRSVDLSQFEEDTPLYPICRAWMINQPKAVYKKLGKKIKKPNPLLVHSVELPGPEGPVVSRIPELLPEQKAVNKDNINLDYHRCPPPPLAALLSAHTARWAAVRRAWVEAARGAEARYEAAGELLMKINVNAL